MQRLLQTGSSSHATFELLQRLQSHGAMSSLSHVGHALRQVASVLLCASTRTNSTSVAIACGPRESAPVAASRSVSGHGLGFGTAVARASRPPSGRVLSAAANSCAVDASGPARILSFLCYVVAF